MFPIMTFPGLFGVVVVILSVRDALKTPEELTEQIQPVEQTEPIANTAPIEPKATPPAKPALSPQTIMTGALLIGGLVVGIPYVEYLRARNVEFMPFWLL